MAFQTVLVHLDGDAQCASRVAAAASLLAPGGLLVGAAMTGVSRLLYPGAADPEGDAYLALHMAFLRERAQAALAAFQDQARAHGVPTSEGRLVDDEVGGGLSLHARVADLVVLSQTGAVPGLAPHVLLHAGRPVLILPPQFPSARARERFSDRILVAWDASREAACALLGALPLLRAAAHVELLVCGSDTGDRAIADGVAAEPVQYLTRHGVAATLRMHLDESKQGRSRRDGVGDTLLAQAADSGAGLLVMGAYAHSRMRETILGGVTRTVLAHMTLPVLMQH